VVQKGIKGGTTMFQKAFSFLGVLLVCGAVILGTAETSQAGHGGGGGGGGHGGGGHGGGGRGGFNHGGFRGGFFYGGYYPYGWYNPYYYGDYAYDNYDTPPVAGYQSYYPSAAVVPNTTTAHVMVRVPAGAELWFNGAKMKSTGSIRTFESPSLQPGNAYTYSAKARWMENGREVIQTRRIDVSAGARIRVSFPLPSGTN
jgi:uncharacterized protein (TIGR03000 family)